MQSSTRHRVPDNREFFAVFLRLRGVGGLVPFR
jgi:hypothetical protein